MSLFTYKVAGACATGRSHIAAQIPCQDAVGFVRKRDMAAVAVADGAGSRAQSQFGAEAVVRAALRMLTGDFDELYELCARDPEAARAFIHEKLMRALKRQANRLECGLDALASTLLCVAHKGDSYVAVHLGDGVIVRVENDGVAHILSHPDNGEYANTTYFVTDSTAQSKIRLYHGTEPPRLAGFALMSDGCAESLYDKRAGTPGAAVSKLLGWTRDKRRSVIASILADNMAQNFTKRSADDCALALLSTPHAG
ncbi:PP2C family serine/threonine-protein phosphatase [Paucibacter sp. R3-3]|uniref:PP2C family serine/threonine-protein phosphatase n=1 Tax=Roseateles agri TaxID=3098619 RepID=A0ABU5DS12_9BURK|nr:PP2C family serine/threonine-protein phosphatase [Paucibacter sp. R3-3]MDY0749107.1 PP2C family serine/threonine-protein phosphatase [Paucibacter sp. R3-3]